jgi:thiamine kinase-like enzyme
MPTLDKNNVLVFNSAPLDSAFTDDIDKIKSKNEKLESIVENLQYRLKFLEKEIENMKLDFLIKLDSILHNDT